MKLTREQAIAEHRKMWNWIAEETEKRKEIVRKREYMAIFFTFDEVFSHCFCCDYAANEYENKCSVFFKSYCDYCPIDWDSKAKELMCCNKEYVDDDRGLFRLWDDIYADDDYEIAAKLARQIAEMPERKE